MAATPGWRTGMSDVARWVAARALPTKLTPPPAPLDQATWRALVDACVRHRLDGLLVAAVASHEMPVDPDQCAEAAAIEVAFTRVRMVYEPKLVEVLGALSSAGIDARLLKGSALAHLDYPDPQMRPTGDIDVLVRGEQIDDAIERFVRDGATRLDPDPVPGYAASVGKGATLLLHGGGELDLHRLLVWGPIGVRLPAGELWETDRRFVVEGHELHTLGLEETLLHVSCHLMVGGRPRGISFARRRPAAGRAGARPGARDRAGPTLGGRSRAGRGGPPHRRGAGSARRSRARFLGVGVRAPSEGPGVAADRSARGSAARSRTGGHLARVAR